MLALYLSLCDSEEQQNKLIYIYEKYYDVMYRAAYKVIRNTETARDLVHETMIKIIKNGTALSIENELSLKNYLAITAQNLAIDYMRVKENQPMVDIDELYGELQNEAAPDLMSDLLIDQEQYDRLVQCIRELPDTLQKACYLKYVCEMGDQAIATELNISYASAAMRIHRGKALLQKKLAEVRNNEK